MKTTRFLAGPLDICAHPGIGGARDESPDPCLILAFDPLDCAGRGVGRLVSEERSEPGPRNSSGHARRRRALSGHGPWRTASARCNPELAKGFGSCRREGSCRRSDGGDRIGFLSPLRVFRFAGHDAYGLAAYIACASSAGGMSASLTSHPPIEKGEENSAFQGGTCLVARVLLRRPSAADSHRVYCPAYGNRAASACPAARRGGSRLVPHPYLCLSLCTITVGKHWASVRDTPPTALA